MKKMLTLLCVSIAFLFPFHSVSAQSAYNELTVAGEYLVTAYSFQSPHNAVGCGLEATRWYRLDGNDEWIRLRNHPSLGLKASLGITPNAICGHRIGLAGMLRNPITPVFDWQMGLGVSAYSRPLSLVSNAENEYISTLFTFFLDFGFVFHLSNRTCLQLQLLHSSNGNLARPNRGLNYLQAGLAFPLGNLPAPEGQWTDIRTKSFERQREVGFAVMIGTTTSRHSLQMGLFPCYNVSLNYGVRPRPTLAYGATLDFWYNGSHTWLIPRYRDYYPVPVYVGAQGYTEGFWGPFSLKLGVGYTLISSTRVEVKVYERLGAYYNIDPRCYVGLAINAHGGQAEFVELTFGYRMLTALKP